MRYALIIAGGSGTRLWPMSTTKLPKQLIPFIGGRSLLQIAMDRLKGFLPPEQIYICAGQGHKDVILDRLSGFTADRFIAEPMGRDTLNAVGLGSAVLGRNDPDAVVAVFTADHIIEPVDQFQQIVERGFETAEQNDNTLVTFGIAPTHAATGYGYLQLGPSINTHAQGVDQFKEKPEKTAAEAYLAAGASQYLWNSGMFVWRCGTMMKCIEKYTPDNHAGLMKIADAWDSVDRDAVLGEVYPTLKKISIDFAVMEPASADPQMTVAAVPMPLSWLDVGSWPAFGETLEKDEAGNATTGGTSGGQTIFHDSRNVLVASDESDHLITTLGCEDLIIIHTAKATLVAKASEAEKIKDLHKVVGEQLGPDWL